MPFKWVVFCHKGCLRTCWRTSRSRWLVSWWFWPSSRSGGNWGTGTQCWYAFCFEEFSPIIIYYNQYYEIDFVSWLIVLFCPDIYSMECWVQACREVCEGVFREAKACGFSTLLLACSDWVREVANPRVRASYFTLPNSYFISIFIFCGIFDKCLFKKFAYNYTDCAWDGSNPNLT